MSKQTYEGQCFCGAVHFEAAGTPEAMGICHCDSCRQWAAAPVNAFTLWKPDAVRVTRGADKVGAFSRAPTSVRKWCTKCGGHIYTEHPLWGVVDVYAAMIPALKFEPAIHVNYAETVLRLRDGKPKFKDMPKEMGGSGDTLPE